MQYKQFAQEEKTKKIDVVRMWISRRGHNNLSFALFCIILLLMITVIHPGYAENIEIQNVSKMRLYFTIDGNDIEAYYTGVLLDNRPYGEGIYEFEDVHGAWSFAGSLEDGSFSNGIMIDYPYVMSFSDEKSYSKYTGPFVNGQPSGKGTYTIITDTVTTILKGEFDPQKRFSGDATNASMSFLYNGVLFSGLYTGEYRNGQAEGNGSFESKDSLFLYYDGIWANGSIVGPGQLHTNNAQMSINGSLARAEYSGHIENGCFNGEGTISINRDDVQYVYSGSWLNNVYSGTGTLSVSNSNSIGYTYCGSWKNGVYNGQGTLIYDNENIIKYIGNFENGKFRPTFTQLITCLCSAQNSKLTLADYTLQYIDKFQDDFINHTPINFNSHFSYEVYAKSQTEDNSVVFSIPLKMVQIKEYDVDVFGYPLTEFIGSDEKNRIYYGYYIGYFDGINSGDTAQIIAYPIGYSSYKSQEGENNISIRFIAYDVK